MTRQDFFAHCLTVYGAEPDYPFAGDFASAVLRHPDNRKWFALVMRVPRRKFGFDDEEAVDVVNLKLPLDLIGSFDEKQGVYPAYHMNKRHWISVLLPDAPDRAVCYLTHASFRATQSKIPAPSRAKSSDRSDV